MRNSWKESATRSCLEPVVDVAKKHFPMLPSGQGSADGHNALGYPITP
jgi:hypothetical protein